MSKIFNPEYLKELGESDEELVQSLLELFQESSKTRLGQLKNELGSGDLEGMRKSAHFIRSSALNLGAIALPETLSKLEHSQTLSKEEITQLIGVAESQLDQLLAAIADYLKGK